MQSKGSLKLNVSHSLFERGRGNMIVAGAKDEILRSDPTTRISGTGGS